MIAVLDTPTGKQAGQMPRRPGVARLASEGALKNMIVKQALAIGRQDGQTPRSHGAAVMRVLAVQLFSTLQIERVARFGVIHTSLLSTKHTSCGIVVEISGS